MPKGGGIFHRDWWQVYESPDGKFPAFEYIIASLDSAFTAKEENDASGFTVWGIFVARGLDKAQRKIEWLTWAITGLTAVLVLDAVVRFLIRR